MIKELALIFPIRIEILFAVEFVILFEVVKDLKDNVILA